MKHTQMILLAGLLLSGSVLGAFPSVTEKQNEFQIETDGMSVTLWKWLGLKLHQKGALKNENFFPVVHPFPKTRIQTESVKILRNDGDVLILHLKRFVERDGTFKKVSSFVEFPTTLDMMPFIVGPQRVETSQESGETDQKGQQIYKLYATINHSGILESGHYTANIFSEHQNKWYTFNDEAVYPTSQNMIVSENAYVLMYKRINNE